MRASFWTLAALLLVLLAPSRALGQTSGDSTLTIAPDGVVSIHVVDCKVHVVGSTRRDVKVTSTSGKVRVTGDGSHVSITVRPGGAPSMDVAVPSGVHLEVRGVDGGIAVHDVAGPVQAGTVDGDISVDRAGRDVEASSVSGSVDVSIKHGDVRASSVSGTVSIHLAAGGTAWAKTVSGPVTVDARTHHGKLDSADAGAPAPGAAQTVLTVWTFGGDVHVERR